MGNCLVLQEKKVIKIMRMDGKILSYQSPLIVHQVLSEFPGHAISDTLPAIDHLDPATDMRCGQLYYLIPSKTPIKETGGTGTGVVRIKLVISKQELKDLLLKGGVTFDSMISLVQRGPSNNNSTSGDGEEKCIGWRPALESIPEGNDC
ncbi:uncharacterized protein [Elaeis guineensis]|uniref:Uncharacterized protein LOC105038251 n=1 Tax=Elaeis guineensis var. tenera TaxID=51953 RepID=A0A6I9QN97_ELAGV|nr:uncharacterized protein LOC105038251 [Elaeis guineensis]